jgi:hypothetical protein
LIDISDPNNVKITDIAIPAEALAGVDGNVAIIEWDSSSNYALVSVGADIIRLDRREPINSQNISKLFNTAMASPHFQGGNNNTVFALSGTDLRRFDISGKTSSAPLVAGVEQYDLFGDGKLAYAATRDGVQSVGFYYGDKDYVVRTYEDILPARVNFTHYYREGYLLVERGKQLEIITKPFAKDHEGSVSVEMPDGAGYLMHNGSGRFVVAGRNNQVFVYDLETSESFQFDTEEFSGKPIWLDDYHLGYTNAGQLKMIEFDGANREGLIVADNFGVFSGNNEHLFTFITLPEGVYLQDSAMLVN